MAVTLLGSRFSPFVNRVVMALELKSIEYELVEISAHDKSELLIKTNPVHKKVPVLIHDGRPICESLVIVQYIDDTWPNGPSILPSHPYDIAIARFWAAFIDDKLVPLNGQMKAAQGEEAKRSIVEKVSETLVLLEAAFISCSKGKAFFGGDNVGYVDIALGSFVGWIKVDEVLIGAKLLDETKTPCLVGWVERLYSDSLVKDVMLDSQQLLEAFIKFKAMKKDAASD